MEMNGGRAPAVWCPVTTEALVIGDGQSGALATRPRDASTRSRAGDQSDVWCKGKRTKSELLDES